MERITIKDKTFSINISESTIQSRIVEMAKQINDDMKDRSPIFLCVLNGAFLFAADIFKNISIECEISFLRVSSYEGTKSTGVVKSLVGVGGNLKDRTIVILEDIVDTGDTAIYLLEEIKKHKPKEIRFASLLFKPKALRHSVKLDYVGFEVPNDFLVGYGLDYDGLGRNLRDIYKLAEN
ncbi:MAG: hypoxanthine phosphoribosyltransferase [Bacteroidia bacterium]|nr:hypoxanthine phosphoribosyltransferase [Bacteroidia bacterium]